MFLRLENFIKKILPVLALFFLNACASNIYADVTRFHDAANFSTGKSFVIVPYQGQEPGLEYKEYAVQIAEHLRANGMAEKVDKAHADYAVYFDYGHKSTETLLSLSPVFMGYEAGYDRSLTIGGPFYRGYNNDYYQTRHIHQFALNVVDLKQGTDEKQVKVFEGKVISRAESANFFKISRCMINAMFIDFPGDNGENRSISLKHKECDSAHTGGTPSP